MLLLQLKKYALALTLQKFIADQSYSGMHTFSQLLIDYYIQFNMTLYHFRQNKRLVDRLCKPDRDSIDLSFPSKYSQSFFGQFITCIWKQNLSYWRNPQYTAVRFFYTVIISLMFGTICWRFGSKRYLGGFFF